eukprot:366181-Chlamydomonas_euryale.AAC.2
MNSFAISTLHAWLERGANHAPHVDGSTHARACQAPHVDANAPHCRLFMSGHLVCMFKFLAAIPAWLRDRILLKKFGLNRPYDEISLNAPLDTKKAA